MVAAGLLAVVISLCVFDCPSTSTTETVCAFRTVTGKPCAFCGMTRALSAAIDLDLSHASDLHPLWWLAALCLLALSVVAILDAVSNSNHLGTLSARITGRIGLIAAVVVLTSILRGTFMR
jgi:hypothetical protein